MKTLMDAPETSPLAMVNVEDIGLFYVQVGFYDEETLFGNQNGVKQFFTFKLTRNSQLQVPCLGGQKGFNVHDDLALTISNYIVSSSDSFYVKNFVRFLVCLEVNFANLIIKLNIYIRLNKFFFAKVNDSNFKNLRELKDLYDQMTTIIGDKNVLKGLEKYGQR